MKKITGTPTLVISDKVWAQIYFLHASVGNKEWSGILFCSQEGSIADPQNLTFRAEDIYLMDIGSESFTSYEFNEKMMDIFDAKPEYMDLKICQIHTHHNMKVFFSGTDNDALLENAPFHNYFLSLIVNIAGDTIARLAFEMESEEKVLSVSRKGDDGAMVTSVLEKQSTVDKFIGYHDVNVLVELDSFFISRLEEVKEEKRKRAIEEKKNLPVKYSGHKVYNKDKYNEYHDGFDDALFDVEKDTPIIPSGELLALDESSSISKSAIELYLSKLISLDMSNEEVLEEVIENKETQYDKNPKDYAYTVANRMAEFYLYIFENEATSTNSHYREVLAKSSNILSNIGGIFCKSLSKQFQRELKYYADGN